MNRREFDYEDASSRCRERAEDNWLKEQGFTEEEQKKVEAEMDAWYQSLDKEVF